MVATARRRYTPRERAKVAYRQEYKCAACSLLLCPEWHLDHVVPLSDGGSNESDNVQALCVSCHTDKSAGETMRPRRVRSASHSHSHSHSLGRLVKFLRSLRGLLRSHLALRSAAAAAASRGPRARPPPRVAA